MTDRTKTGEDAMADDKRLSRRSLRAMEGRWQRDLQRLETAYPVTDWQNDEPGVETIRNLATAIAQIQGIIAHRFMCRGDPPSNKGLIHDDD